MGSVEIMTLYFILVVIERKPNAVFIRHQIISGQEKGKNPVWNFNNRLVILTSIKP